MAGTIIGSNISIDGEISGSDSLTVLGVVRGRVSVKESVTVSEGGRIEADVDATSIEVAGVLEGNIAVSESIELKAGGKLVGDVRAPRVLIADGATFKGNINPQ